MVLSNKYLFIIEYLQPKIFNEKVEFLLYMYILSDRNRRITSKYIFDRIMFIL